MSGKLYAITRSETDLKNGPKVEVVGQFDDKANGGEATRITDDLLTAHSSLAEFCGFDSNPEPGTGLPVWEEGWAGAMKIITVDGGVWIRVSS